MPKVRNFTVLPALPEPLKDLENIARNLFWSWNAEFVELFERIDNKLWSASGHNPVKLLSTVSQQRLEELAQNKGFLCQLQRASEKLNAYLQAPTWFHRKVSSQSPSDCGEKVCSKNTTPIIAYFSPEFAIHESLPIYAGGLGVLAADHLKSASDLGVPMVGLGLLYQKGYFRQYLNIDGWQQETYIENDFYNMPMELVRKKSGRPLTISVEYPGRSVLAQIWQLLIGRVKLYLLDTNISANSSTDRLITASLYGGNQEMRIQQEIILGIGGLKALTAMHINPAVCHINEGHAAFVILERIRQLRTASNMTFDQAVEATRSANIFTIHTLVKAGLDEFPPELMDKYFGSYFPKLGINRDRFLALGRILPDDDGESFKMPILGLRLCSHINGVSELHGQISREVWSCLWPGAPVDEVPICSITNGVHIKSWLSNEMNNLYEKHFGANWTDETIEKSLWSNIEQIPDEQIWQAHQKCKHNLIVFARKRLKAQMKRRGTYHSELNHAEEVLDPDALTIGFARRFAGCKRASLLLKEPARLVRLLSDPDRPVQILFAGKAHPKDTEGKEIIRQIIHFANKFNVRRRILFLEDYDINVARAMFQGVDVWLNTPRRPMEASGTSGMKAAINGALNLSTLDGWWCEGYKPETGWAIGAGESYDDHAYQDTVEAQALYNLLESEIVPLFYTRSADNLPRAWINRMKHAVKFILPRFNTDRMITEYVRRFYNPALAKWQYFTADDMSHARELSGWKENIKEAWPDLDIKDVKVFISNGREDEELEPKATSLQSRLAVKCQRTCKARRPPTR
ncbi:MAG: alpha-glucan family phosphorylase [Planctomycetota bacterium]|jgi:starch phosphorylase